MNVIITKFNDYLNFINENYNTKRIKEVERISNECIEEIDKIISNYKEFKIGKTSKIETIFDTYYKSQGFIELIRIKKCDNKYAMDNLEKFLIKHYNKHNKNVNYQDGGGNKSYTNDYWIYIVVK